MQQAAPSIKELFFAALELESSEARSAFLNRHCGDTELRRRIEELLSVDAIESDFLEVPAAMPTVTAAPDSRSGGVEEPGTTIGPYKLLEPIGEGGMGTVFMAEQTEPVRRRVALKVIKPGMDSRQVITRFEAERQALAMMDHPNIAKVHDGGATESGRPYFVMELVRGLPITEYCDREQLSIPERLELFTLVCRAVQHAHQKGVIHRDLKPSNVLVTVIDGVAVPKVIDFGVAKATGQSLTEKTLFTGFHQFVGTPLYVSPEQADLSGVDVDTRSDIYSLGVLLYELLTGTTPFDPEALKLAAFDEMRRLLREEEPPKPSTRLNSLGASRTTVSDNRKADSRRLERAVRGELDWIVMKALEKDRRRRYETANDFAADVMRFLTDRPVEAGPPSAWYRFSKYARRNRTVLITGAVVTAAVIAGSAVSVWQAVRATGAERRASGAFRAADAQRRQAEERFRFARQAVDEMYTRVAEKWLAEQPSLTPLQKEFLEKALAFYQRFATEAGTDPENRHQAVMAALRVGKIRRAMEQHAEAEAALRRAVDQSADLAGRYPDRPEYLRGRALAHYELARVLEKTGRVNEAERELHQALTGQERLRDSDPAAAEPRYELAIIHRNLGDLLSRAVGRRDEALAAGRTAVATAEALVNDFPSVAAYRLELAKDCEFLGDRLAGREDDEAEKALRKSLDHLAALKQDHSRDVEYRDVLASAWKSLGAFLIYRDRLSEAEDACRTGLEIREALAAELPDIPRYQQNLAGSLNNLSIVYRKLGRTKEWEEHLRKAIAIMERTAERYPEVPGYRHDLALSKHNLFNILWGRKEFLEARRLMEQLLPQAEALADAHPRNASYNGHYFNLVKLMGALLLELGDHAAAARLAEGLARRDLPGDDWRWGIPLEAGWLLTRCALAAERDTAAPPARREETAAAYIERARSLLSEAEQRGSNAPALLAEMAQILTTIEAHDLRDPSKALVMARRAAEMEPKSASARTTLGLAEYRNDRSEDAIAAAEKSLELSGGKTDGRVWLVLALARARSGDISRAREAFGRAEQERQKLIKATGRSWDKVTRGGSALHVLYDEVAALLGEERPPVEAGEEPAPGPKAPPD
jgi:serine/threonine protein kinase